MKMTKEQALAKIRNWVPDDAIVSLSATLSRTIKKDDTTPPSIIKHTAKVIGIIEITFECKEEDYKEQI